MFLDKRIGEKDSNLSAEDRMIARFTAERVKGAGKTSIFNIGDDYDLTHGGENLSEIDKFGNPNSDNDEDEETLLGKEFVDQAHFGGFMTKADDDFKAGKSNSRKDIIENLIRESKKKKAEKRKAEEEAEEKTTALDQGWKNIFGKVRTGLKLRDEDPAASYDPYDMLVKQLSFQKKEAKAGERLKTDEEKVKDEKERLQKLEEDRLRRMRGEKEGEVTSHFNVEDIGGKEGVKKLTRKERRDLEKAEKKRSKSEGTKEGSDDDSSGEEEEGEEEEEGDCDGEEEEGGDAEESDEEGEDNNSDLDEDSDREEENGGENQEIYNEKDAFDQETVEMMDKASKEIPYIIKVHDSYESFSALVWDRSPGDLKIILDRILATSHPQVSNDKLLLVPHYQHMLQYIQDLCQSYQAELLQVAVTHVATLTPLFQQAAATDILACIQHKAQETWEGGRLRYPSLDTLIILHLVHLVLPTSDYRHPVVTPALTLICQILSSARPTDRAGFSSCVSLCSVTLEYVSMSRRLVPELLTTLHGLIYVASGENKTRPPPPCKGGNYLVLSKKFSSDNVSKLNLSEVNSVKEMDDSFKVTVLTSALRIIIKLLKLYRDIPSSFELFEPMLAPLSCVNPENYPAQTSDMLSQVQDSIKSLKKKKAPVVKPSKKTPMLKMMEPKIEEDFDPFVKKREGKKDVLEAQKMKHKLKQEKKGARKEIRQDTAFLASQRMREQRQKDQDRQAKTKALFASLANQEGDYNKLLKKKKKKF